MPLDIFSTTTVTTWVSSHPIASVFITLYLLSMLWNVYCLFLKPKPNRDDVEIISVPPSAGKDDGQPAKKFQIRRTRSNGDPKTPVLVFESQLGLTLESWSYTQSRLDGLFGTLSYNHLGYGRSSDPFIGSTAPRDAEVLAKDLFDLLNVLGLIPHADDDEDVPSIILVGHSFGGLTVRAFQAIYNPPNLLGMILLDTPHPQMPTDFPLLQEFLNTRLPRVFNTASSIADLGFLRILSYMGVSMIQPTETMQQLLDPRELNELKEGVLEGRTLRIVGREIAGLCKSMEFVSKRNPLTVAQKSKGKGKDVWKDGDIAVVVVTVQNVEKPMVDVGLPYDQWKDKWHGYQRNLTSLNRNVAIMETKKAFLMDDQSDHMSLCVSGKVLEAVSIIVTAHNIKIKVDNPDDT
ncbi:hypothetical protein HDV05_007980 [Chytridiales sp. JEL 0842]|nr:hypothetical protein HDV05_007980 [Chytridiales sp. JEL 0842]